MGNQQSSALEDCELVIPGLQTAHKFPRPKYKHHIYHKRVLEVALSTAVHMLVFSHSVLLLSGTRKSLGK